ncbi:hypothetical protein ACFQYP_04980 [Nonomuraea antimicrobica]
MSSFVVALDVGGTSMKGGLVSESGAVLLSERRPTPGRRVLRRSSPPSPTSSATSPPRETASRRASGWPCRAW